MPLFQSRIKVLSRDKLASFADCGGCAIQRVIFPSPQSVMKFESILEQETTFLLLLVSQNSQLSPGGNVCIRTFYIQRKEGKNR